MPTRPDPGYGPPAGSPADSPWAQQIDPRSLPGVIDERLGGTIDPLKSHPAFQPPTPPLTGQTREGARTIYRDIPIISSLTEWRLEQMRASLRANMWGVFDGVAQLADEILGDDRVQATLGSRISGLFGREVRHRPANDSIAAKECCDAWVECWPRIATAQVMSALQTYAILMGWVPASIRWDTGGKWWCPQLYLWHPRYTYYHWDLRKFIALTQDGQVAIQAGNANWLLHAPFGEYRGWVRGAIRAVAEPWIIRHWAIRDWARYSEKHGLPIVKGICPASAEEAQRDAFEQRLSQLATETTIMVSEGNDGQNRYDVELVEATDTSWESFPGLRDHCDMAIVLAIKYQNLTTEIRSGGSLAASRTHENVDDNTFAYDNAAWSWTLREQVARPFAWLNFGDPNLAPTTDWDTTPREDYAHNAKQFTEFGRAIQQLSAGGVKFLDTEEVRKFCRERFGLNGLPDFMIGDPPSSAGVGGGGSFGGGSMGASASGQKLLAMYEAWRSRRA